jgi:hypothetical protein
VADGVPHGPAVFRSLSWRRLLDADVPQLDGLAGPDDEVANGPVGEDPKGRARDQSRPNDPPVSIGDPGEAELNV